MSELPGVQLLVEELRGSHSAVERPMRMMESPAMIMMARWSCSMEAVRTRNEPERPTRAPRMV